jgi:hypothetical protein
MIPKNFRTRYKRNNPTMTITAQPSRFGSLFEHKELILQKSL